MQQLSMRLTLAALVTALVAAGAAGTSLLRKTGVVPKKDVKLKNPMKHSAGDVIGKPKPPAPKGQEYDHMYEPVSPKSRKDLSPTDPAEHFEGWEGAVAEVFDHLSGEEVRRFEGATCESVCAACSIFAAQQDGMCYCYATCKMGECGMGSALPHIGWSNNEVTTPKTMWSATCNVGVKNCEAECMKDELKKQVKECQDAKGNPTDCFKRLSQMNQPLPLDARKQVHYCLRKGMETCDTFMNVPADPEWICYSLPTKCKEMAARGFRTPVANQIQSPSVWESVTNQR